jgi:hypothetical protein
MILKHAFYTWLMQMLKKKEKLKKAFSPFATKVPMTEEINHLQPSFISTTSSSAELANRMIFTRKRKYSGLLG